MGNITAHIKSLNFGYRAALMNEKVTYKNMRGEFVDPHTIKGTDRKGKEVRQHVALLDAQLMMLTECADDIHGAEYRPCGGRSADHPFDRGIRARDHER